MRECREEGIAAPSHSPIEVLNSVKTSDSEGVLLLNLGPEPGIKWRVFDTLRK